MSQQGHDTSRRRFLHNGLMAVAVVPVGALVAGVARPARAAEDMPKLSLDDPAAKALNYHHDATKVQPEVREEETFCHNCQLYTGKPNAQWGGCSAFPGKLVNADGWCSAWVAAS